jgi:hypothetical protein
MLGVGVLGLWGDPETPVISLSALLNVAESVDAVSLENVKATIAEV